MCYLMGVTHQLHVVSNIKKHQPTCISKHWNSTRSQHKYEIKTCKNCKNLVSQKIYNSTYVNRKWMNHRGLYVFNRAPQIEPSRIPLDMHQWIEINKCWCIGGCGTSVLKLQFLFLDRKITLDDHKGDDIT